VVVPEPVPATKPVTRLVPIAPRRFALQATIGQSTHDKLRRLQELLGHQVPSGDVAEVLDRAFDALLEKLERAKCAATDRPRRNPPPPSAHPRQIPAHVKRQVWARDGGRCTFVSDSGQRCLARKFLEYDHVQEVARGGRATVANIRLRCRAHNQLAAERTFGREFMRARRAAWQRTRRAVLATCGDQDIPEKREPRARFDRVLADPVLSHASTGGVD
jgi:5-methylcytosine-specific restriction endonuclease McrA